MIRRTLSWLLVIACSLVFFLGVLPRDLPVQAQQSRSTCTQPPNLRLNRWVQLTEPPSESLEAVANFPGNPCSFLGITSQGAVFTSEDGGQRWNSREALPAGVVVHDVVAQGLAEGTAFVLAGAEVGAPGVSPSGLYVTRDFGSTFEPVPFFVGRSVVALAAAPADSDTIYASAPLDSGNVGAGGTIFKSSDGGGLWTPLAGSSVLKALSLSVDARAPELLWVNNRPGEELSSIEGLWRSDDEQAQTFVQVNARVIHDLDVSSISGGGSRLDAATANGILRTRNRGGSFTVQQPDRSVTAIAHETEYPRVLMAVVEGEAVRSLDEGQTFASTGLGGLASCRHRLSADDEAPSLFILSVSDCPSAGHYLYRSDGRDILNQTSATAPAFGGIPDLGGVRPVPMEILARHPVAESASGSVAFDGTTLYYAAEDPDDDQLGTYTTIYMLDAKTGEPIGSFKPQAVGEVAPTLVSSLTYSYRTVTYDSTRNVLWSVVRVDGDQGLYEATRLYSIDLDTHEATPTFDIPPDYAGAHTLSFEPAVGNFYAVEEFGDELFEIDMTGQVVRSCDLPVVVTQLPRPVPFYVGGLPAGFTAAGDGSVYIQDEDDSSITHVSRDCELLEVYVHPTFAEAPGENEGIACDTVTFERPAIWLKDTAFGMIAFAVPDGYCPVASRLRVVPPVQRTLTGTPTPICAALSVAATREEIDGVPVRFYIEGNFIGSSLTNLMGLSCITYTPDQDPGTELDVFAAFLGNVSYLPSDAEGKVILREPPPTGPITPLQDHPGLGLGLFPGGPPPPPFEPVPGPVAAQAPAQAPAPQMQPAPAPASAAQPQAMMAAQRQEQPQMAFVHAAQELKEQGAASHAMSALDNQRRSRPSDYLRVGAGAMSLMLLYGYASVQAARVWFQRQRR